MFLPTVISVNIAQRGKLFYFNSYIDLEYDPTILDEDLAIEKSTNLPITIEYQTDIPENFLWWLPFKRIKNYILFGSLKDPTQKIHIEVVDPPDWASIYISQPDTFVDIPRQGTVSAKTTSVVIAPREKAPAVQYTIELEAKCETIGRINNASITKDISFTPTYVPALTIIPSSATVNTPPNNMTIIPVIIKNHGNAKTRITPSDKNSPDNYSIIFNPPFIDLNMDETGTINLTAKPPSNFQGHLTLKVDFTAERFPKRENSPVGGPYSLLFDLYYEPEESEGVNFYPYLIIGIVILIVIVCFFIFYRYRRSR